MKNKVISFFLIMLLGSSAFPQTIHVTLLCNDTAICVGSCTQLSAHITGASGLVNFTWTPTSGLSGNDSVKTACPATSTTYKVVARDALNHKDSTTAYIHVKSLPDPTLTDPISDFNNCAGAGIDPSFEIYVLNSSSSSNSSYTIVWGDGTPNYTSTTFTDTTHTYTSLGIYSLVFQVTGTNGCVASQTYTVKNISNPSISFGSFGGTTGCGPKTICFPITNFSSNHSSTTYTIDFGDGSSTINLSHPPPDSICHTYTTTSCGHNLPDNCFIASITAQNTCASTIVTVNNIKIYTKAQAGFTAVQEACLNQPVTFTNTSIGGYNSSCSSFALVNWNFGDGHTSTVTNPTHTYTNYGSFVVTLKVQNYCGIDSIKHTICIKPPPIANFHVSDSIFCKPDTVFITNQSNVISSCGATNYTWNVTCVNDSCSNPGCSGYSYIGGTNNNSVNPKLLFTKPGKYTITLTADDGCAPAGTYSKTIRVETKPTISLSGITSPICQGQSITPSATYTNCYSTISSYLWAFTSGTPSSSTFPTPGSITYNSAGTFSISVTAGNACGDTTVTSSIIVKPLPIATQISNIAVCPGVHIGSINFSSSPAGATYSWTNSNTAIGLGASGTGNISGWNAPANGTGANITGTINVTPTLNGCSGTVMSFTVTIYPTPTVTHLSNIAVCPAATIAIPAFGGNLSGTTYTWTNSNTSIGLGASGTGDINSWTAPANGTTSNITGTIVVTPTSTNGCVGSTMSFTVTIYPTPTVTQLSNIAVCPATTINVPAFTSNLTGTTYAWTNSNTAIGLGASGTGNINSWTAPANGTGSNITGTITVTPSKNGCTGPTMSFTVTIYPTPTATQLSNIAVCPGATITVPAFSSNLTGTTYTWTNNNTFIGLGASGSGNNIPSWTAPSNGTISNITGTITVTPTSANGCIGSTMSFSVTIYPTPTVTQFGDIAVCPSATITVPAFSSNLTGTTYTWTNSNTSIGLGASGSGDIPYWTAPTNGTASNITGTITVTPTSTNGCIGSTMSFSVTIYPTPTVTQLSDIATCPGATITVPAFTGNMTGIIYTWTNNNTSIGLVSSGSGNISSWTAPANATGLDITGTITVTPTKNGCSGLPMSFTVTIYPTPTVTQLSNITVCPAATITIPAFSSNLTGTTYTWTNSNTSIGLGVSGSGDISSWTAPTNATSSNITGIITVTPISTNGCIGTPMNFTVAIYPTPTATQLSDIAVCSAVTITIPAFSSNLTGTAYTWTNSNTSIGLGASGTGNINSWIAPANGTLSNITGTITVTPTSANGCIGSTMSFTVTIYPTPTVTQLSNIAVCPAATINVPVFTSNLTGTTYSWSNSNIAIGLGASGTGDISPWTAPANITGSNITGTVIVTPLNNGCTGPTMSFTITIYPTPVITQIQDTTVCPGMLINFGTFTSVPSGNTINWTNTDPAIGLASSGTGNITPWIAPQNGTDSTITAIISVTATSANGCISAPMIFVVGIATKFNMTATPMVQTICSNINTNISLHASYPGVTFSWTVSSPIGITGASAGSGSAINQFIINTTSSLDTVRYTITPSIGGCSADPVIVKLAVYPFPVITQLNNIAVCPGATITISDFASNLTGTTFLWTNSNIFIGLGASGTGNISSWTAPANGTSADITGIIEVTPLSTDGCYGTPMGFTITIYPTPTVTQLSDIAVCPGVTITVPAFTSNITGTAYTWTNSNTQIGLGASGTGSINSWIAPSNATGSNITGTITVTPSKNGCIGTPMNFAVTIYPTPTVTPISNIAVCPTLTIAVPVFVSNLTGTIFSWTNNNTSIGLGASGTGSIPSWAAPANGTTSNITGTIIVTPLSLDGCTGNPISFTVTIYPTPSVTQVNNITVCPGQQINIGNFVSVPSGNTINWTNTNIDIGLVASGTGNISSWTAPPNGTLSNITGTITVTPTSVNDCVGAPMSFTISIAPVPNVTANPMVQSICSNISTNISLGSSYTGTTFSWTISSPPGITGASAGSGASINQILTNTTNVTDTVLYTITPLLGACSGISIIVKIAGYPIPTVTQISNLAVCPVSTITIPVFSSNLTGTTFSWTNNNTSIGLGASGSGDIALWTAPANGTTSNITGTITVTPTSTDGCPGTVMSFTVTIYPTPTVTQLSNIAVCPAAIITVPAFTSNLTGTTYSWTNTNTQIGLGVSGTGNILTWTAPANATSSDITGTVTVTPSKNGCTGPTMSFTVTINPTPTVTQLSNIAVCPGATITVPSFTGNLVGTTYSWTNNNTTIGIVASGSGDITSWTAPANGTISNIMGTITVTPISSNGCYGSPMNFTVAIYPTPAVTQVSNISVCPGQQINIGNFVSVPSGNTINWTNTNTTIGLSAGGTGNISSWTAPPNGTSSGITGTITATPTSAHGCMGAPMSFTVTIDPVPDVTATPMIQSICNNVNTTISIGSSYPGTIFSWTVYSPPGITGASAGSGTSINQTLVNTTFNTDTVKYTITPLLGSCPGIPIVVKVIVFHSTTVNANPSSQAICGGDQTNISLTSTPPNVTFSWTVNVPVGITGAVAGSGSLINQTLVNSTNVALIVNYNVTPYANGCPGTVSVIPITVNPIPIASANPSQVSICSGVTTQISLSSTVSGTTFNWTVNAPVGISGATAGSGNQIQQTLTTSLTVIDTVYYTITPITTASCTGTPITVMAIVKPNPVISISSASQTICSGDTSTPVLFSSNVIGTTYNWTASIPGYISGSLPSGTGNIPAWVLLNSSNISGTIVYTATPTANSCPGSSGQASVIVNPKPSVTNSPMVQHICSEQTSSAVILTSNVANTFFNWIVIHSGVITGYTASGTNSIPPQQLFNVSYDIDTVVYHIIPSINSGLICEGNAADYRIIVHPLPHAIFSMSDSIGCNPLLISFTNQSIPSGLIYNWNFGNGHTSTLQNPITTFTNTGIIDSTYHVRLIITTPIYGCTDTVVHFVTIHPLPIPNFTGTNVCLGLPTVFTDASTNTTGIINSWHWNFGDGGTSNIQNPTHIYASPGNYSVSLAITNTNQCINTIIKQVTVYPLPGVSFTHDSLVCKGTVVQFSNNTFGAQSYLWNFGDGNTSTLTNPTHTYLNQGYYKINLIATSVHGCIDSIANSIHVIQTPTPNFSVTPGHGCAPLNVLIADLTAGSHVIYYWDFGIPPTSTSSGPFNLTYPQGIYDTTYFITLTTSNMCGTASHIDSARVSPQPVVNFHMSQNWGCSPLSIQFLDAIISLPDTLKWDFGDGTSGITSTNFNHPITHTFYYSGTNDTIYTISLIATNKCGSDTMRKTVTEYPNTVNAFFSIDTTFGCEPFTVHFTNYSSGNNQSSWAFGDGNFSNSVSPTHTYTSPGHFVVMLAVTNGCSFDTTYSNPIIVNTRATPNFTFNDNVCHGDTVFFTNLASGITNFLWNFGDGSPESTLSNPYHVYNASGTYALTLTVNNLFNCSSDTTIPIHIRFASNASFSTNSDMGCSPVNVQFTNLTDNLNNNTYFWYFNNGNYSVMITPPLQTFTNSSNCLDTIYNIILIANPNTNCTDTFYSSITVHPLAAPNFTFNDNVCRGDTVFFTNLSTSCITNFSWNFGDGSAESSLLNPYHVYNTSGTNPLTLTANNLFNCPSDITVPVHIRFTPHASFSTNSDIGCSPINEQFVNHTDSLNFNTYIWYFNNGNSSVMITPPLQTFTNYSNCRDTVYNIILIANNVNCIDTFYSSITVHPNPLSNFYSADSIFCSFDAPVSVQFNQQSICAQGFQWYIGNNLASANQNPVITFPGTATYWVGLISSNQYQCVDTATKKFIVYPNLQSNIVINPTSGCEPLGVEFEMLADSLDYIWEFGDNTTSTLSNPFHLYQNNGVYSVHIYITGNGGCTDSLIYNDTIHVNPNAQASFTYQNIHNPPPNNGSILFTNTSQDATSFIWNFGDGTMYYGLDTIHRYLSNNFYDIILISNNQYNCPDTATVRINLDFFDGLFVPNAFSPTNSNSLVQNFNPIGIGLVSFNIQVYDTWGNIIWESSALDSEGRPTEFWDGKTKDGQSLPMDTYVWRATGTFKDGSIWQGMDYGNGKFRNYGTVTILK